jgi:uncharacterized protein
MRPIIDADGHLDERPDEIIDYLDPPLHGEAIVGRGHGLFPSWQATENRARTLLHGESHPPYRLDPTPAGWLAFAERAGLEQAILYPTDALSFGLCEDPAVAAPLARAYNTWAHARYMQHSPRLKCVALVPLQDVAAAVRELRRAVTELGMPGAFLPAVNPRGPLGGADYWPLYEEAERLGCFLGVHGGHMGRGRDVLAGLRGAGLLHHPISQIVELTSMVSAGVFETFPRLKVGYLEAGCGWVPFLLDRLDEKWSGPGSRSPLKRKPSSYVRDGSIYFSAEPEESALPLVIERVGADHLFVASDFPHELSDDGFLTHLDEWRERTDIPDAALEQILTETAREAYALGRLAPASA